MKVRQPVKLEDVAARAGVSKTTVSRVLNQRGYLSQATIKKVHQAMAELHYRPNAIARSLVKQENYLVGLVFPTVNDPFFGQLEAKLDEILYRDGTRVLMGNSQNNPQKEEQYLKLLLNHQILGLIVGAHNPEIVKYPEIDLPIVSIERYVGRHIPVVTSDGYQGGQLATQRLIDDGCIKIIHTNNYPHQATSTNKQRRRGYEDTMREQGLAPCTYEVQFDAPLAAKRAVFERLFADHPDVDSIFADNDLNAGLIISIAHQRGLRVPEDLKVVGYDGTDTSRAIMPELTTIQQPVDEMATAAVRLLKRRIAGEQDVASVTLPVKLLAGTTA